MSFLKIEQVDALHAAKAQAEMADWMMFAHLAQINWEGLELEAAALLWRDPSTHYLEYYSVFLQMRESSLLSLEQQRQLSVEFTTYQEKFRQKYDLVRLKYEEWCTSNPTIFADVENFTSQSYEQLIALMPKLREGASILLDAALLTPSQMTPYLRESALLLLPIFHNFQALIMKMSNFYSIYKEVKIIKHLIIGDTGEVQLVRPPAYATEYYASVSDTLSIAIDRILGPEDVAGPSI